VSLKNNFMDDLTLTGTVIPPTQLASIFKHKYQYFSRLSKTFLGYPIDFGFDQSFVHQFTSFNLNNVGDPFAYSSLLMN
jgi:hypothetical protein